MNPAEPTAPPEADDGPPWSRLDRKMLLVHPVEELLRLLPVLIGSVVIGTSSGNPFWGLATAGVLVVVGLLRWFTTTYRIGAVHVELRRGLLQRQELSIPRSRIRSVDVEQRVLHRLLGLAVVKIGTGQSAGGGDRNRFELNGLAMGAVPALRESLLAAGTDADSDEPRPSERDIARFDPRWTWYAPFSTTGLVGVAALAGVAFQAGFARRITESRFVRRGVEVAETTGPVVVLTGLVVVVLVFASVAACVRYVLLYGNLRVTDDGRVLRIGHGLLKTRHTTLDRARLRGVNMREPLALRLVGAGRLDAIMTGVAAEQGGSSLVLPAAPGSDVRRVAAEVLTDSLPVTVALRPHGPAARRRRYVRALGPVALLLVGVLASLAVAGRLPAAAVTAGLTVTLLAAAAGLAWDRDRGLGHAVVAGRLVTRSGSIDRQRVSLDAEGIIGWTVRQSFFQRRAGLATLVAATPAGSGRYEVLDIPADLAWSLVDEISPWIADRRLS